MILDINDVTYAGRTAIVRLVNTDVKMLCDCEDWDRLRQYRWSLGNRGYARAYISGKYENFHTLIIPRKRGLVFDHINLNRLDNRKSNIRQITFTANLKHKGSYSNNTSGFKGVSFHKDRRKYQAYIRVNGKARYLGLYDSAELAKEAVEYAQTALTGPVEMEGAEYSARQLREMRGEY